CRDHEEGQLSLKQRTLADLMDRAWGRPAQAVSVSGAVVHANWTPGKYSHLTDDEFAKLAELSAKALAPQLLDAPQNGRGFQVESSTAHRSGSGRARQPEAVESPLRGDKVFRSPQWNSSTR